MQGIDGVCRRASRDSAGRPVLHFVNLQNMFKSLSHCNFLTIYNPRYSRFSGKNHKSAYQSRIDSWFIALSPSRSSPVSRLRVDHGLLRENGVEITGKMLSSAKIETKNGDTRTRKLEPGYLNLSIYQLVSLKSPNSGYHQF